MSDTSTAKKKLLRNASWLFSGGVSASLFAVIELAVLARFLGLDQFGLFSIVVAYVNIVNGVFDFKVKEAVVKYVGQCRERKDKVKLFSFIKLFYLIDCLSGVVAFVAVLLLSDIANRLFIRSESAFEMVFIYSFSLLVSTVNTNSRAILEVFSKFRALALADMLSVAVRVIFVFTFLVAGFGVKGVLLAYVTAAFVSFFILQFLVNQTLRDGGLKGWFAANLKSAKDEIKDVALFVLSSTVSTFFGRVLNKNFPLLVLGHFFGNETSGLYKTAVAFSKVVHKLKAPARRVIYPALVSLEERGAYKDFKQVISYSIKILLRLFVPAGAVFFIFANEIIGIFFGAEYVPAANAMRIIVVAEILSGFSFWIAAAYLALGRVWFRTVITLASALCYFVSLFYLTSLYSLEGAAFAKLSTYLILLPAAIFLFRDISKRSAQQSC